MKKVFYGLFILAILMPGTKVFAQDHNLKLDITALLSAELRLNYEYTLDDNKSVVIMAGTMLPHKIPSLIYNSDAIEEEFGGDVNLQNRFSGYMFGAQFRFYVGESTVPAGFYVAPYFKYHRYSIKTSVLYENYITESQYQDLNDDEQTHAEYVGPDNYLYANTGIFDGSLSRLGGGLALGYQWHINDALTIDWTFIGIGVERLTARLEVSSASENYDPDYQQWADDIESGAEDFFFIGDRLDVEVESDMVKVELPITIPLPYSAVTIGYTF
ncbi:MAG: DUF3575 domain-containing protein [Bacteroidales bacterium]|nr:DUF3575 domain-containing protein [Bacteroidales bacterium]